MNSLDQLASKLQELITEADKRRPQAYDTPAEVLRIDKNDPSTVWVHIPGGVDETPVKRTIDAKPGDTVMVRVANGSAWIHGNEDSPPTDDTMAYLADQNASIAGMAAQSAIAMAQAAQEAADIAWDKAAEAIRAAAIADGKAADATRYANNALAGLSTLESVIDTVNWFAAHKQLTSDTTVDSHKTYYVYDRETRTLTAVTPKGTENPSQKGWYELTDAIADYVAEHVAVTNDGLFVVNIQDGWKVCVSTGYGIYPAGVHIIDPNGHKAQSMTAGGITFDPEKPFVIGDQEGDASITYDGNGNIFINGEGIVFGDPTITGLSSNVAEINSAMSVDTTNMMVRFGDPNGYHLLIDSSGIDDSNPNRGLSFWQGSESSSENRTAYIHGRYMTIPYTVVINAMDVGALTGSRWRWEHDENSHHLTLKWIAGS